jgi:hypothetical protein
MPNEVVILNGTEGGVKDLLYLFFNPAQSAARQYPSAWARFPAGPLKRLGRIVRLRSWMRGKCPRQRGWHYVDGSLLLESKPLCLAGKKWPDAEKVAVRKIDSS